MRANERQRRDADLFFEQLTGGSSRAPVEHGSPSPLMRHPIIGEGADESLLNDAVDAAQLFDEVVYRGADPNPLLDTGDDRDAWQVIALPNSATSPEVFGEGQLVFNRGLGEGRLGCVQVLGEDIQVAELYGRGLRVRGDVLVLGRQSARPVASSVLESTRHPSEAQQALESVDLQPIPQEEESTEVAWEQAVPEDIADSLAMLERIEERIEEEDVSSAVVASRPAVTIEVASGLGSSRTKSPIATVSPQRQMNAVLDRELILFAKARIVAAWLDRHLSSTYEQAFADTALRARLDVSRDRALLDRLRPFPNQQIPARRGQLFTTDAVLQPLLRAPQDSAAMWPIFDVLHHYGVVLLVPDRNNPFGRPSIMASITRVEARLTRERFDRDTKAIEDKAIAFKKAVANKSALHHLVESDLIPADWSAGKRGQELRVAKPVLQLLSRLRSLNKDWRAGTYPGHWWNDFSIDMFVSAPLEPSGFWKRDKMRAFFEALNAACVQDGRPGTFAWKGIYNDAGLAQEMDALYGSGRVLFGVDGHGPGPRMHVHLDVRPLAVPFDESTGFWLDGPRVVLKQPPARPAIEAPPPAPIAPTAGAREDVSESVPQRGGGTFRHAPLGGDGDNVEARWNVDSTIAAGSAIDVVVYLHGYGEPRADFLARKAAAAGVDLVDDSGKITVRRTRPTLALVPRGRHTSASRWVFDALPDAKAFTALIDAGLSWLRTTVLKSTGAAFTCGRVTLIAHSGGGAAMSTLLQSGLDPDEVVCFDSLYGGEDPIRRWAEGRIASAKASQSALRAFYTGCSGPNPKFPAGRWVTTDAGKPVYEAPGSWLFWPSDNRWHLISTEVAARRLQHAIDKALGTTGSPLQARFRVERTTVGHSSIPARYSPLLIDDITANVPNAAAAPASTTRPPCVGNDDWLTHLPRKPGGDEPPPPKP
jgi:hypothetical protein